MEKQSIRNITREQLKHFLVEHGEKPFRVKQIWQWLWQKNVTNFEAMINLPKTTKDLLEENFTFHTVDVQQLQKSTDGTTKMGLSLYDGNLIETVLIPSRDKYTVCVSSQIGCKLNCNFCATGDLGYKRNLDAEEIVDQVALARKMAEEKNSSLSNIVLMGMGEPLFNYENVLLAIQHITSDYGLAMSPSRITLSTAGLPEGIKRLADDEVRFNLAISLHSAIDKVRDSIMPLNKVYPLDVLAHSIKYFVDKTGTRPTFEYLLMKGINDSLEDAKALALYCRQFPVKINIIEYNPVDNKPYERSPDKNRDNFINFLESKNMVVNLRRSKGKDIDAACGQLANKNK